MPGNEIITKFLGRKRSAPQGIYSRSLEQVRSLESWRNQCPKYMITLSPQVICGQA